MRQIPNSILFIFLLAAVACQPGKDEVADYPGAVVTVDYAAEPNELPHFWKSSGFSHGRMSLHPDMQQTLQYTRTTASNGVDYMRPHYLLDLTAAWGFESGKPQYHWAPLDSALDVMHELGYSLIFEFMGKPWINPDSIRMGYKYNDPAGQVADKVRSHFSDLTQEAQVRQWHQYAEALVSHLQERYGDQWLETWYFETVNEPDLSWFWPYGDEALLDYYDACYAAVKSVNPNYQMGGPGTAHHLSDTFKAFIAHADTGKSVITGKPVELDYYSVHLKRLPDTMVLRQTEVLDYVRTHHPRLGKKPFINDEADPTWGWREHWWWRAHPWYASFVVRSAHRSFEDFALGQQVDYRIQSNDNAFQGSFANRTQLARFQDEAQPEQFYLIKQQVLEIMSHLARFGHQHYPDSASGHLPYVGAFATKRPGGYALALYNAPDIPVRDTEKKTYTPSDTLSQILQAADTTVMLHLTGIEEGDYYLVHYALDSASGAMAPYRKMGFPDVLTAAQAAVLREAQEATLVAEPQRFGIEGSFSQEVYLHGGAVHVFQLVEADAAIATPEPAGMAMYKGLNGEDERLVYWSTGNNFAVRTYQVEASTDGANWSRLNKVDVIDGAFMHSPVDPAQATSYRIRAVGYNGETTPWVGFD